MGDSSTVRDSVHVPVLLHEIISAFSSKDYPFWYLDGTLGGAGHALAVALAYEKANDKKLSIIGLDRDSQVVERAKKTLEGKADRLILECEDFRNLDAVIDRHASEIRAQADQSSTVNAIILDLGISSDELENSGRGFTFQKDEPLLMSMGDPASTAGKKKISPMSSLDMEKTVSPGGSLMPSLSIEGRSGSRQPWSLPRS
jgi:16S rRNA (cytosine1402-N4)-methyltransferase